MDVKQRRFDIHAGARNLNGFFKAARFRLGVTDYRHFELEDGEIGTTFDNEAWDSRFEAVHRRDEFWSGSFGLQLTNRDLTVVGDEAFLPPTDTFTWALFAFEEFGQGPWKWQIGCRYESREIDTPESIPFNRDLDGFSASLGVLKSVDRGFHFSGSLGRSVKLPNAEELFASGPHLATQQFEIGDSALAVEKSVGLDLAFGHHGPTWDVELNLFWYDFDGFIRLTPTRQVIDDLDVFQYTQSGAEFTGGELELDFELYHSHPHHLELRFTAEYVRAEDSDTGDPLPRIPPLKAVLGLEYENERVWWSAQWVWVQPQKRIAGFETRTEGYSMLSASVGFRFFTNTSAHDLILRGGNLNDELARNHVSFLKDVAPLPGREVGLIYRLSF